MAVRFDASGDYLRRTANLPADNSYTICGWARLVTDTNTYSTLCSIESATTSAAGFHLLSTDVDGVSLKVWNDGGAGTTIATLTTGTAFFWALVADGRAAGNIRGYYRADGTNALSTQNASTGATSFTSAALYIANDSYTEPFSGRVWNVKVWDRALSASELLIESFYERPQYPASLNCWWPLPNSSDTADRGPNARNPTVGGTLTTEDSTVVLWRPKIRTFVPVAAGSTYTLTADAGTYTLTGDASNLEFGRLVGANAGSYTLTGADATLTYTPVSSYTLTADGGSYTLTGDASNLEFGRLLNAESGTYVLTGADALRDLSMVALEGSYTLTGADATLTYAPSSSYTLTADGGSFTLTGADANLEFGRLVSAEAGVYTLTGTDASLERGWTITADGGAYTYTGTDASLLFGRTVAADAGSYALTGADATLVYDQNNPTLVAEEGSFVLSGGDASLTYNGNQNSGGWPMPPRKRRKKREEEPQEEAAEEPTQEPPQEQPEPPKQRLEGAVNRAIDQLAKDYAAEFVAAQRRQSEALAADLQRAAIEQQMARQRRMREEEELVLMLLLKPSKRSKQPA